MTGAPTGNTYDKYASANRVEAALVERFLTRLDRSLPPARPRRTLEVGTGEGVVSARVAERLPGARLVGVDLPDPDLADEWAARDLLGAFADGAALPFPDDAFDLVLAIEVLEHVPDPDAVLAEIARVGSGRVVLSVPLEPLWRVGNVARRRYVRQLGNTPGHVNHWGRRAFARLVARHLEVESVANPVPWTLVVARVRS